MDINDFTCRYSATVGFSDIRKVVTTHVNNDPVFVWTNDLAAFYHQIPLDHSVRCFFVFPFANKHYRLTTIATGQRHSVQLAQCLCLLLARLTTGQSTVDVTTDYLLGNIDVYIDDFMFASTEMRTAVSTAQRFCDLCDEFKVSRNLSSSVATDFQDRGVDFFVDNGQVAARVAPKTIRKLEEALHSDPHTWSIERMQNVFGLLIYCSNIYRLPTNKYYYVFKFVRRRSRVTLQPLAPANVWECTFPLWSAWLNTALRATRRRDSDSPPYIIVADASTNGWGAIVFHPNGSVTPVAGRWTSHMQYRHINVKETFAVVFAIRAIVPPASFVHITVDNTCALHCLRKQRSRNFDINLATQILNDYHIVEVCYIQSEENPADGLSRLFN